MEGHFVVTSHPKYTDLENLVCDAVRGKIVPVTATEYFPNGDELEARRAARTRRLTRTFLLKRLQVYFEPVLTFIAEDQTTQVRVVVCPTLDGKKVMLRIGFLHREEA
jgi:hypothetical protein